MSKKVIDFTARRNEKVEQKRRNIERVVLNDILGCYSVIDDSGSHYPVKLIDVSGDGCLFEIPERDNSPQYFKKNKEIALRFYFTESTFLPIVANIKHMSEHRENNKDYVRIGCEFDKSLPSFAAMEKFVEFLYKFAEFSSQDKGDLKVYFL